MLTPEQIDFFHANGFLVMRGVFRGRELEQLQRAADAVQAQGVARQGDLHLYMKQEDGSDVYWRSEAVWNRGDIFRAVTVHPDLLENIGQCIGQTFYPWNDSFVVKLASNGAAVAWHQDPPYMGNNRYTTYPVPNFTTDIYLDHSGVDNGCVWAIPGHHLVGGVGLPGKSQEELFRDYGAVPVEMEAGDVMFHALSTPHGSAPNSSPIERRIFYIHYLAEEVFMDGYGREGWAKDKPGWDEARAALVHDMIRCRVAQGFDDPTQRGTLNFGDTGIDFVGSPTSPPRHWETLAAAIPPDRREAMKRLDRTT